MTDQLTIVDLAEALARRYQAARGHRTLEFRYQDGRLVKSYAHHGPIGPDELDAARTERVERLVDRVIDEHREALEKLGDE